MTDARDLYQSLVLDHGNAPRRQGKLDAPTHEARRTNPLCGDRITLYVRLEGDIVRAVAFEARGCLLSRASASILGDLVEGHTAEEAHALCMNLRKLTRDPEPPAELGPLEPLRPVRAFPARLACIELAWDCLDAALAAR